MDTAANGVISLQGINEKNQNVINVIGSGASFTTGNTTVATGAIVDNATVFIVENDTTSGKTYSRYVGKDNMFSYTNGQHLLC